MFQKLRPAMTAFMIFVAQSGENIRKENPNANDYEIGKKMVDQWNHLSKEEREHYEELSKKDQEARKKAKHS